MARGRGPSSPLTANIYEREDRSYKDRCYLYLVNSASAIASWLFICVIPLSAVRQAAASRINRREAFMKRPVPVIGSKEVNVTLACRPASYMAASHM